MATRQYIGARYVPQFWNGPNGTEWDDDHAYEALTIVTNLGNSYTSKKAVPIGVQITNTEYWALTGAYNAQVEQYRQEVEEVSDEVDDLRQIVERNVKLRRIVCITDSYGTHSENNWMAILKNRLGIDDGDFFSYAEGSSGFSHAGLSGNTFLDLLENHSTQITDHDSIDAVIFGGGTNDFYYFTTVSALTEAIGQAISYCKSEYPNARIYIDFMGYVCNMSNVMHQNYIKTMNIYQNAAVNNGADFINSYVFMHDPALREDTMHPNDTCNVLLGDHIFAHLMGSDYDLNTAKGIVETEAEVQTAFPSFVTGGTPGKMKMKVAGDTTIFDIPKVSTLMGARQITAGAGIIVFDFDNELFNFPKDMTFNASITLAASDDTNPITNGTFQFAIDDNDSTVTHLYFFPTLSVNNIVGISIARFTLTAPTIMC